MVCPTARAQASPADLVLSFRDPTGTVFSDQSFDVWVTLRNTHLTDAFSFDLRLPPPSVPLTGGAWGFGQASLPTQGYDSLGNLHPFASYTGAGKFTFGSCGDDSFVHPSGCGTGPYSTAVPASDNWFIGQSLTLAPGASVDINLTTLTPNGGQAPAGTYRLSFQGLGVQALGVNLANEAIYNDVFAVGTCDGQLASNCFFERQVLAVPEPATWMSLAAGLGLLAWRRRWPRPH